MYAIGISLSSLGLRTKEIRVRASKISIAFHLSQGEIPNVLIVDQQKFISS